MKFNYKKIIFCFVIILLSNWSYGQVDLEQSIENAKNNNQRLKATNQMYLSSLEKADQVSSLSDPEVRLGMFTPPMNGHAGKNWFRFRVMQSIPWFGTLEAKKELALVEAAIWNKKTAIEQLEIIHNLKLAWLDIYEIKNKKTYIESSLQILDQLEKVTLVNVETGKVSPTSVLKIQLEIEKLKNEILLLENQERTPIAKFNQLLNEELATSIDINSNLELAEMDFDKSSFLENISNKHPSIQQLNLKQEAANKSLEVNDLAKKPDFSFGIEWGYVAKYENVTFRGNGTDMMMAMAQVKVPIYQKQYRAKEQEEQKKIIAYEHQKTEYASQFLTMIESAYAMHQDAILKMELYEKQKRIIKSAIDILETNFSTSGKGFEDLLDMQLELINYDKMILEAIVQSHVAKATVEKYILK